MLTFRRNEISLVVAGFVICTLLSPSGCSSIEPLESVDSSLELSPKLLFQIKLHAFLLWASIGFLMPVGILIIRMSQRVECGQRLKILFYSHVILQIASVLLSTAAAVLSVKNFENLFTNTHQRMGLALYALIWIQALIGFCRPHRGVKVRSIWYFSHWLLGTAISLIGIMNMYIGFHAYVNKTSRSVRMWATLFTAEIAIMVLVYLLQDRWDYLKKQGVILGDEQITPTNHVTPPKSNKKNELGVMLQMVEYR